MAGALRVAFGAYNRLAWRSTTITAWSRSSLLVAILASYAALTLAIADPAFDRLGDARLAAGRRLRHGRSGSGPCISSACSRCRCRSPITYDLATTLLSLVVVIVVSTCALGLASRRRRAARSALVIVGDRDGDRHLLDALHRHGGDPDRAGHPLRAGLGGRLGPHRRRRLIRRDLDRLHRTAPTRADGAPPPHLSARSAWDSPSAGMHYAGMAAARFPADAHERTRVGFSRQAAGSPAAVATADHGLRADCHALLLSYLEARAAARAAPDPCLAGRGAGEAAAPRTSSWPCWGTSCATRSRRSATPSTCSIASIPHPRQGEVRAGHHRAARRRTCHASSMTCSTSVAPPPARCPCSMQPMELGQAVRAAAVAALADRRNARRPRASTARCRGCLDQWRPDQDRAGRDQSRDECGPAHPGAAARSRSGSRAGRRAVLIGDRRRRRHGRRDLRRSAFELFFQAEQGARSRRGAAWASGSRSCAASSSCMAASSRVESAGRGQGRDVHDTVAGVDRARPAGAMRVALGDAARTQRRAASCSSTTRSMGC